MKNACMYKKLVMHVVTMVSLLLLVGCATDVSSATKSQGHLSLSTIAAGDYHTVLLKEDGTVDVRGINNDGQCDIYDWEDIVQVDAGEIHTVGLRADGTVVAVGSNRRGCCEVDSWHGIQQIAATQLATYGLKTDGTVVTTEDSSEVITWTDIKQIFGGDYVAGIKNDGTVVAAGCDPLAKKTIETWTDIVKVANGKYFVFGVKADGTFVVAGENKEFYEEEFKEWKNIVDVSLKHRGMMVLLSDGTVEFWGSGDGRIPPEYDETKWHDIVDVIKGYHHYIGLRSDGTLVADKSITGNFSSDYSYLDMNELEAINGVRVPSK